MRRARDEMRKGIKADFDAKLVSENDKFRLEQEVDKVSKAATDKIDALKAAKQQEVMTV